MRKCFVYNKEKYYENLDKVNRACLGIITSREMHRENYQAEKDKLNELIGNMFLDDSNALIFILTCEDGNGRNLPASFALFTSTDKPKTWVLEMIFTHKDRSNNNHAETLFKYALKHLKNKLGAEEVVANVANNNTKSINFHNKMLNTFVEGKCFKGDGLDIDPEEIDPFDGENEDDVLNNENFDSDMLATNAGVTKFCFDLTKNFKDINVEASLANTTVGAINAKKEKIKE